MPFLCILLSIFIPLSAHLTQLNQYLNMHKVNGTEATIVQCIVRSLTTVDTLDANLSLIAFQSNSSDEAGVA
jgi:hypothetical protein